MRDYFQEELGGAALATAPDDAFAADFGAPAIPTLSVNAIVDPFNPQSEARKTYIPTEAPAPEPKQPAGVRLPLAFYAGLAEDPTMKALFSDAADSSNDVLQLERDYAQGTVPEEIARTLGAATAGIGMQLPLILGAGSVMEAAKLGQLASNALPKVLTSRVAWLPWITQRATHSAGTFGLAKLAQTTVEGIAEGHLDPEEMASETGRAALFGGTVGVIGAGPTLTGRVARGVAGGAAMTLLQGGTLVQATVNAVLFGAFELMSGPATMGRKVAAFHEAEKATSEYLMAQNPNLTTSQAQALFRSAVAGDLRKAGVNPTPEAITEALSTTPAKRLEEIAARVRGLDPQAPISPPEGVPGATALPRPVSPPSGPIAPQPQPGAQPAGVQPAAASERAAIIQELGGPEAQTRFGAVGQLSDQDLMRVWDEQEAQKPTAEGIVTALKVEQAANQAATSPKNDLPEPTEAQKDAGNWQKGHVSVQGLNISIEYPRGSERSGVSKDGKPWTQTMSHHYGAIVGTSGRDAENVDVFIGPDPASQQVFVVDQVVPETGAFDESKAMLGFKTQGAATTGYLANYEKGWQGLGNITPMSMEQFKEWVTSRDAKQPAAQVLKPAPKKIPKSVMTLLPEEFEAATSAIEAIESGQPGRRMRTETGEWYGIASTYPSYFKNKGYTRKDSVSALQKALAGEPVTEKQKDLALDIITGSLAQLQAEKEAYDATLAAKSEQARVEGFTPEQISSTQVAGKGEAQGDLETEGAPLPEGATEFNPAELEAEVPLTESQISNLAGQHLPIPKTDVIRLRYRLPDGYIPIETQYVWSDVRARSMGQESEIISTRPPVQQQLPGAEPKLPPGKIQPPVLFQEGAGPLFEPSQAEGPPSTTTLPPGWTEASPGGLATNKNPVTGGIVDVDASGKWFYVSNHPEIAKAVEGFPTRESALTALQHHVAEVTHVEKPLAIASSSDQQRWDDLSKAQRTDIAKAVAWRVESGELSRTGIKVVARAWEALTPAAQNVISRYFENHPEGLTGELPPGTLVAEGTDDVGALPLAEGGRVSSVQPRRAGGVPARSPYRAAARSLRVRFVQSGSLPLVDVPIASPEDVAFIFKELTHQAQENIYVLAVRADGRPIGAVHAAIGRLDSSSIAPLQVLTLALQRHADAIWLVHNHPSGNPNPSREDIRTTRELAQMLGRAPTGITLKGHIIIEGGKFGFIDRSGFVTTPATAPRTITGTVPVYRTTQYRTATRTPTPIASPEDVAAYLKAMVYPEKPLITMLALNTNNNLVGHFPLPETKALPALTREILRRLALVNANHLILAMTPERTLDAESLRSLALMLNNYTMSLTDALVITPTGEVHRPAGVHMVNAAGETSLELAVKRIAETPSSYALGESKPGEREIPTEGDGGEPGEPMVYGGMDDLKPFELPELVQLHKAISPTGATPGLKKFPKMLGRAPYPGGIAKIHPWLFLTQEAVDQLKADVAQYVNPETLAPTGAGKPPKGLIEKWLWVKRAWEPDLAIKVLAHEIGHLVDWLPDENLKRGNAIGRAISSLHTFLKGEFGELVNRQLRKELKSLTQYWKPFDAENAKPSYKAYRYSAKEMYADFISVLFNDPAKAQELAPTFYQAFFDHLDAKPAVKEEFFQLQELLNGTTADLLTQRAQDIGGMFEKGEDLYRARQLQAAQARRNLLFRLKYLFVDTNTALLEKRAEVAAKQDIRPNEDPKYLIEEMNMIGSKVHADLMDFQPTYEALQQGGVSFEDFGQYLFLTRVAGERAGIANPLGHTAKTAEAQLQFLKQTLGDEKFALLERSTSQMRAWFKQGNQQLFDAGLLTPEQFAAIQTNDTYAPFRVLDHWKEWVGAGIIRQKGDLGDIGNPATAMVLKRVAMVRAAERNRITRDVMRWLLAHDPETVEAPVTHFPEGTIPHVAPRPDREAVLWREAGTWKAAYVDPYIYESVRRDRPEEIAAIGELLGQLTLNQSFFRPLFITYNLGFQSFNLVRDYLRFWKNTPGLTMAQAVRAYGKAVPHAIARVRNQLDPLIAQMEREGALNPTFTTMLLGQTSEDAEIDAILKKANVLSHAPSAPRVLQPLVRLLNVIQDLGDIIETIPKVAGFMELEDVPKEARAYRVRNLVGTPNYKRRGVATPITNNLFLFSNIWKEGLRSDYEAAFKDPKTRAGWWWKTAKIGLLPKILMAAFAAGLLGPERKRQMDAATEYDKTNYTVLPLGEQNGKAIYLRIPMDETTRYLSALFWKTITRKGVGDVFTYTAGQIPSAAPMLNILLTWAALAKGQNPRDSFRGRDILTDDELKAGGVEALWPMLRWTMNQTGMVKLDVHERVKDQTLLERIVALTPVINRWVRVTNYGEIETLRRAAAPVAAEEARTRLGRKRQIVELLNAGVSDPQEAVRRLNISPDEEGAFTGAFNRMAARKDNDPLVNAIFSASSNEQKTAVLMQHRESFDSDAAFEQAINTLTQEMPTLISRKVRDRLRVLFEERRKPAPVGK